MSLRYPSVSPLTRGEVRERNLDYTGALHRLLQLIDLERMPSSPRVRVRYNLGRMEALLSRLGDPHMAVPTVHVAGTKGKGSTAAMVAAVLNQHGYHTGLFSSPHMHSFRERIRLGGLPVSEEEFVALSEEVWPDLEWVGDNGVWGEVTMFEALTAMAFCHFRRWASFQVLEVGLGGRLDTTNLVGPPALKVCAITSLSLDHTAILGNTLESIAGEKAGIIKPGVPVVTSPQRPEAMAVIESVCRQKGAPLIKAGEDLTWRGTARGPDGQELEVRGRLGEYGLWIPLLGAFQLENAATAVGALEALIEQGTEIPDDAIVEGMKSVTWPCRMEVLSKAPLVVCDGAHNPHSAAVLRDTLPDYFDYRRVLLVVGVSRDKNMEGIVGELAGLTSDVIATRSRHPRAATAGAVAGAFAGPGVEAAQVEGVDAAVSKAMEGSREGDLVLVTGSLFVAAEAREAILGIEPELYPQLQKVSDPPRTGPRRR